MNLLTRQQLADAVAERWRSYYQDDIAEWRPIPRVATTYSRLKALGDHPDPDAVMKVASACGRHARVANTILRCCCCLEEVDSLVEVDDNWSTEEEYGPPAYCEACVQRMLEVFGG